MIFVITFVFGIFLGSFLNVIIDRIPNGESFIMGRSHCDYCKKKLSWYDLIPLFSFLLLKGRCRYCGKRISIYYLITEFTTGILFVLSLSFFISKNPDIFLNSTVVTYFISLLTIIAFLAIIFFIDLKFGIIPDKIVYPSIFVTMVYLIASSQNIINNFIVGIVCFLFFLLLFMFTRKKGIGFGDVKYSFFMGFFLGFPKIIIGMYGAFLTGAFISLILVLAGKKKFKGGTIPFGPFLVLGTLAALFYGNQIAEILFKGAIR